MGFKVIIIGAGLAGALLANGLLNNNVDFEIYERDGEFSKREGYQIRLGDAAMRGFDACLKPERIDAIMSRFGQSENANATAPSLYSSKYRLLMDLTLFPNYSKSSAINRVVLRDALLETFHGSGLVNYKKGFQSYENVKGKDGQDMIRVRFSDNSTADCNLLIGADGSGSKLNKQLGLDNLVTMETHWSFVCKGSLSPSRIQQLPENLRRGPILVFSKGAALYYALYLPPAKSPSKTEGALDFDEKSSSFYWGLSIPKSHVSIKHTSEILDKRQFVLDYVRKWAPQYTHMLSMGNGEEGDSEVINVPLRASKKPSKNWRSQAFSKQKGDGNPRVWLIGDAIHAMLPNRGMGGNQALSDCADVLPAILKLRDQAESGRGLSTEDFKKACALFESVMIERAFEWVSKSGGASMPMLNMDGPLGWLVFVLGRTLAFSVKGYRKLFK